MPRYLRYGGNSQSVEAKRSFVWPDLLKYDSVEEFIQSAIRCNVYARNLRGIPVRFSAMSVAT